MKLLLNAISQLSLFNNIFQSEIKIGYNTIKQERSWKGNFAYDLCPFMHTIDVSFVVVVLYCLVFICDCTLLI